MKTSLNCLLASVVLGAACCGAAAPLASSAFSAAADSLSFVKTEPDERYKLYGAPSVILRLKNEDALGEIDLSSDERPANVILTLDDGMNVLSSSGGVIGSFADVFAQIYLAAIPVAEIKTQSVAEAFVSAYESNKISDIAVLSDNADVLSYVRGALPGIRGIYELLRKTAYG